MSLDGERESGVMWETVRSWGVAILVVIAIRLFVFEPFKIPSGSMVPTLLIGDHVVVSKYSYGIWLPLIHKEIVDLGDPERGDVIVFRYPKNERLNYIKRVVAIPGDTVEVSWNKVTLNGEELVTSVSSDGPQLTYLDENCYPRTMRHFDEDLIGVNHDILTRSLGGGTLQQTKITIPEGHVFVMGDNRDNSEDSRAWGLVKYSQIKGKAHFIWMSWDSCNESEFFRNDRFLSSLYRD